MRVESWSAFMKKISFPPLKRQPGHRNWLSKRLPNIRIITEETLYAIVPTISNFSGSINSHKICTSISQDNDIALLKLATPVPLGNVFVPACLPAGNNFTFEGENATAAGKINRRHMQNHNCTHLYANCWIETLFWTISGWGSKHDSKVVIFTVWSSDINIFGMNSDFWRWSSIWCSPESNCPSDVQLWL